MEQNNLNKQTAPNSVVALVLGIASLVFGCFFVGLACGIVGLIFANKGLAQYNANPNQYSGKGMLTAGKITSIIGIIIGGLYIVYFIIWGLILGSASLEIFDLLDL
ncbi:MAG: hypothetical protein J6V35_02745 [Bacteroidales bacterium]|nr:hypothetical protein [Bacteroidales bacterium]